MKKFFPIVAFVCSSHASEQPIRPTVEAFAEVVTEEQQAAARLISIMPEAAAKTGTILPYFISKHMNASKEFDNIARIKTVLLACIHRKNYWIVGTEDFARGEGNDSIISCLNRNNLSKKDAQFAFSKTRDPYFGKIEKDLQR